MNICRTALKIADYANGEVIAYVPEDFAFQAIEAYNELNDGFVYWAEAASMRELTGHEKMVLDFMDKVGRFYHIHFKEQVAAGNYGTAEDILEDACERYEDWATD